MTDRTQKPKEDDLVSATLLQMKRWDDRLLEIDAEQRSLDAEKSAILGKKEAASALVATLSHGPIQAPCETEVAETQRRRRNTQLIGAINAHTTWIDAVTLLVTNAPLGLTHSELREAIEGGPLGKKFKASQKGYYHALTRLADRKTIVRHNGRVFSPEAYREYQRKVQAGELRDEPAPKANAYSPMGEAILDIVFANPGITSRDIIQELRTDPEFNASLTPHTTGAFNIMSRLARRKQLVRFDDGTCHPGPNMPKRVPTSKWLQRSLLLLEPTPKRSAP